MPRKVYKCSKCDRSFKMAAHLARHVSSAHGAKKKTKIAKRGKKRTMKKGGRPKGAVSRFGLKTMSLERLTELIGAARTEARRRLTDLEESIG